MSNVLIAPTVGRVVWFYPASNTAESGFARHPDGGGPYAAVIAHVWNDHMVNLSVFDANGAAHSRTSITLLHDDDAATDSAFCVWMPFQKGQAKAQAQNETRTYSDGTVATGPSPLPAPSPAQQDAAVEQIIQAKRKTAPRITPADIEANISSEVSFVVGNVLQGPVSDSTKLLTICVLTLQNGFTVTGESACASPENFDAEIGHRVARENAKQKIWPLMGYALKQQLHDKAEA